MNTYGDCHGVGCSNSAVDKFDLDSADEDSSRTMSPWIIAQQTIAPWTTAPSTITPGQMPPRTIAPRQFPLRAIAPGQFRLTIPT